MDTTELLKAALAAVQDAGVPKELQATALELAVADLRTGRANQKSGAGPTRNDNKPRAGAIKQAPRRKAAQADAEDGVLARIPEESVFFAAIEKETGVSATDLGDIFHIDNGRLELKIPSRDLGQNKRAQTQTVTALIAGAVIAGTAERSLLFSELNRICHAKHCLDSANSASSIKSTPGFSSVGSAKTQAVVTRNGWQDHFASATRRVLRKPDPNKGVE